MRYVTKNIKISESHHKKIKEYCEKNGLIIHRVIEKLIDEHLNKGKRPKDIYDE